MNESARAMNESARAIELVVHRGVQQQPDKQQRLCSWSWSCECLVFVLTHTLTVACAFIHTQGT
jgi:hypothetical protein